MGGRLGAEEIDHIIVDELNQDSPAIKQRF